LPFADNSFDILFHFGGVNLFNNPDLALREFVRVVRRGGCAKKANLRISY
jgi:ubiquinone/menaquinone biosynthesis C-methylase UbiE